MNWISSAEQIMPLIDFIKIYGSDETEIDYW